MTKPIDKAIRQYEIFHQREPNDVAEVALRIPDRIYRVGEAVDVMYRSDKADPETLRIPRKPVDYIHDHKSGVHCYRVDDRHGVPTKVPQFIHAAALVRLGECLGFTYRDDDGDEIEARVKRPRPDLCTIPSGKALLVVDVEANKVLAMMWGGELCVEARGIVG